MQGMLTCCQNILYNYRMMILAPHAKLSAFDELRDTPIASKLKASECMNEWT